MTRLPALGLALGMAALLGACATPPDDGVTQVAKASRECSTQTGSMICHDRQANSSNTNIISGDAIRAEGGLAPASPMRAPPTGPIGH